MAARGGSVHVVTTRRTYKGKVYETHLLRRSYREGGKVKNETVGNLSHLPADVVDLVRRTLQGERFAPAAEAFEVSQSRAHGDTAAVLLAMKRLGLRALLSTRPCAEADLVMAMVCARIVAPHTKLATTRWWKTRTLAEDLGVVASTEDDLYAAMDWLLEHQAAIEKKLAARHLGEGGLALYDLTSSYFEGTKCPLARIGYSRDGKKNRLQVNYGLLAARGGCPVAVSVYEGNTADAKTVMHQVVKLKEDFGIEKIVLVGDRGMIGQTAIEELRHTDGLGWITALKSGQIRSLLEGGTLQLGLFDERNLFELTHPDFPDERLVACRNPELGRLRAHKRQALLEATTQELAKIRERVQNGKLREAGKIGVRVGRVVNKYKVAKHFNLVVTNDGFDFSLRNDEVEAEAALDGLYVIRTSLSKKAMSAADAVRSYKALSDVERAFRSMKTIDLKVRPIHHRDANRVRAHIFLCMLAYYVEWHMREAWRPILFADEDTTAKAKRNPVSPAKRSPEALHKVATLKLEDGLPVHSFRTLLEDLASIVRNTCHAAADSSGLHSFEVTTTPSPAQQRALALLDTITT